MMTTITTAIDKLGSPVHLAALHFWLCISNETEPYLVLFQAERPLAVFLFEIEGASCIPYGKVC